MHVNADRRQVEPHRDRQVGGLAANAGELAQFLDRIRQRSAETFGQHFRQRLEMFGLIAVEPDRIYQFFDASNRQLFESVGSVPAGREQPFHGGGRAGVLGSGAEYCTHQHAEGIVGLSFDKFDYRGGVRLEFSLERPVDGRYVLYSHVHMIPQSLL